MFFIVLAIHCVLCIILVLLVLLQEGKDIGASFGAGGSQSIFGASGIDKPIVRATTMVAVLFMITSILLVRLYSAPSVSIIPQSATGLPDELSRVNKAVQVEAEAVKGVADETAPAAANAPVAPVVPAAEPAKPAEETKK